MDFFQNAQTDAKEFLSKKGRVDKRSSEVHFSFSDFEREVQKRQADFKKEVLQKMKDFIEKMRAREKQLETYLELRQAHFRQIEERLASGHAMSTQTDFAFDEYLKRTDAQRRQLECKCAALQTLKDREEIYLHKENEFKYELAVKEKEIEKYIIKKKQLKEEICSLRRYLREEKSKKMIMYPDRSLKIIETETDEKGEEMPADEKGKTPEKKGEESSKQSSNRNLNSYWKRKVSNDASSSVFSMNEMASEEREESSANHHKRKFNNRQTMNPNYKKVNQSKTVSISGATQTEPEGDEDRQSSQAPDITTSFNGRLNHHSSEESAKN